MNDSRQNNEVNLDFDRENRTGLAEAVFCRGKSLQQLQDICKQINESGKSMLFTKLESDLFEQLGDNLPDNFPDSFLDYDPISQTAFHKPYQSKSKDLVAVVTGGSSDVPVAREASRTLKCAQNSQSIVKISAGKMCHRANGTVISNRIPLKIQKKSGPGILSETSARNSLNSPL